MVVSFIWRAWQESLGPSLVLALALLGPLRVPNRLSCRFVEPSRLLFTGDREPNPGAKTRN